MAEHAHISEGYASQRGDMAARPLRITPNPEPMTSVGQAQNFTQQAPDEPAPAPVEAAPEVAGMKIAELRQLAKQRGLSARGSKAELVKRLS